MGQKVVTLLELVPVRLLIDENIQSQYNNLDRLLGKKCFSAVSPQTISPPSLSQKKMGTNPVFKIDTEVLFYKVLTLFVGYLEILKL